MLKRVMHKARKFHGEIYPATPTEYSVDVTIDRKNKANNTVTIIRDGEEDKPRTFKVGDYAIYDSYNLYYVGKIVSITEKTVTIDENGSYDHIDKVEICRLDMYKFSWRNWNYDEEETAAYNANERMYI